MRPEFTGRVDLGHLIQAAIFILTAAGMSAGVFGMVQSQISAQAVELGRLQEHIAAQDRTLTRLADDQRRLSDAIVAGLDKLDGRLREVAAAASAHDGRR